MSAFIDFTPEDWPDEPVILSERTHTARKDHACTRCGGVILSGDRYTKTVLIDDDDGFAEYKEHVRCPESRPALYDPDAEEIDRWRDEMDAWLSGEAV